MGLYWVRGKSYLDFGQNCEVGADMELLPCSGILWAAEG